MKRASSFSMNRLFGDRLFGAPLSGVLILTVALAAGALLGSSQLAQAAPRAAGAAGQQDATSAAQAKLKKSEFKGVQVSVDQDGIATLTGTVPLYEIKADAEKRVAHAKGVKAVRDEIQVAGSNVSDAEIEKKLGQELSYNREGYGLVFDAITLNVQNGVVTLGGHVHDYPNRDSAVAQAATTPGVKDVVDDIQVDPVSQMDWGIRMAEFRAIYGYAALEKYAMVPIRPIRISVQNGHVELYGTVDSQADKELVYMRANSVPGVFSVQNDLQVAGQPSEKQ